MVNVENDHDRETRCLNRAKTVAILARDTVVARLKSIVELSKRIDSDSSLVLQFLVASGDLDSLWESFVVKNQAVLDALLDLGSADEFSVDLESEVRMYYITALNVVEQYKAPSVEGVQSTHGDVDATDGSCKSSGHSRHFGSRLPEIPLPTFSGDILGWPVFRDRFNALIVSRADISNVERFYYLLGCLHGEALRAIRGITVSDRNYDLAWSTLSDRFDKPRQLAALIIDKLISTPSQSQESLEGLKEFLTLFSDNVTMLQSLDVPDLGEFLLFSLSVRFWPLAIRKGFEAVNNQKFPSLVDIVSYVQNRVSLLETVSMSGSIQLVSRQSKPKLSTAFRPADRKPKVTLVVSKSISSPVSKCLFCSGNHKSSSCANFIDLSIDDRYKSARDKKICFRCLDSKHWSVQCKLNKSCNKCSGRHHSLLHRTNVLTNTISNEPGVSLVGSSNQPIVLLGTALVHIRDHSGVMHSARALIDSASQISAITSACSSRLGIRMSKWTAPVSGLSGAPVVNVQGIVDCCIQPRFCTEPIIPFKAWVFPTITAEMPRQPISEAIASKYQHLALADPSFSSPATIDLLLGADVFAEVFDGKRVTVGHEYPTTFGSIFGWILIGCKISAS